MLRNFHKENPTRLHLSWDSIFNDYYFQNQEKEGLQREGDQLDANIRKAEKEIHALENTIKVMNARNTMYRSNFTKVEQTSKCLLYHHLSW